MDIDSNVRNELRQARGQGRCRHMEGAGIEREKRERERDLYICMYACMHVCMYNICM